MSDEIAKTASVEASQLTTTSNIWEDLKERLSAPFFASFIISWIICNWKIVVVLFWFGKDVDGPTGATTRIELIYKYSSQWRTMWFPLVLAIGYCWLYPAFKAFSDWLVAHIKTRASGKILKASGKAKVDMSVFLDLKTQYDKANKTLEKEIEATSVFQKEKAEYQQIINKQKIEINEKSGLLSNAILQNSDFELKLKEYEKSLSVSSYLGKYKVNFHALNAINNKSSDAETTIEILLSSEKGYVLKFEAPKNGFSKEYYIIDVLSNKENNYTTFLLSTDPQTEDNVTMILVMNIISRIQNIYEGMLTNVEYREYALFTKE